MTPDHTFSGAEPVLLKELGDAVCGLELGSGAYRRVFEHAWLPDVVVKVEKHHDLHANITEWLIWEEAAGTDLQQWLAPCRFMTPAGKFLIQDRTQPVTREEVPVKIPTFFTDLKVQNWGRLTDGRIVCHDYANNRLSNALHAQGKRLRKAEWWDATASS